MVNEWTRDDLPDHVAIRDVDYMHGDGTRSRVIDLTLDMVVGHLNANHQKPEPDRWRRAHEIVERERDQAREERDDAEQRYRDTAKALTEWHGRWVEMERVRDEWRARAEAAEARTAPAVTRAGVKNAIDTCFALAPKINTQVISDAVCDFIGIEAESADPLLDKAQEFAALADWELTDREAELLHTVAAHVLGREVK